MQVREGSLYPGTVVPAITAVASLKKQRGGLEITTPNRVDIRFVPLLRNCRPLPAGGPSMAIRAVDPLTNRLALILRRTGHRQNDCQMTVTKTDPTRAMKPPAPLGVQRITAALDRLIRVIRWCPLCSARGSPARSTDRGSAGSRCVLMGPDHGRVDRQQFLQIRVNARRSRPATRTSSKIL